MRLPFALPGNRQGNREGRNSAELHPMRWLPITALVLTTVVGGGLAAIEVLTVWANRHSAGMSAADAAGLRLEAIKTGLTVAAGLGAGVTLLVALRKQSITERAQRHIEMAQRFAEDDAREQRITALYVAAADQLGNERAAVRLAGLYALERLGQDTAKLRQTVTDVICAYLRMPYVVPVEIRHDHADGPEPEPAREAERLEELEVRLTAQRLLRDNTRVAGEGEPATYWRTERGDRMNVDLAGAVLVDFDLANCVLEQVTMKRSQLHGDTNLGGAQFHGEADWAGARFHGEMNLHGAQFHQNADLGGAHFHGDAYLGKVTFHEYGRLSEAEFHADAYLTGTHFNRIAGFRDVQFRGDCHLHGAQFSGDVYLYGAQFHGDVHLAGAQFCGDADLQRVRFYRDARLDQAHFRLTVELADALVTPRTHLPQGWTTAQQAAAQPDPELLVAVPAPQRTERVRS